MCFDFLFFGFGFFKTHSPDKSTADSLGQHFKANGFEMALPEDLFSLLAFSRSHVTKVRRLGPLKNIYHEVHLMWKTKGEAFILKAAYGTVMVWGRKNKSPDHESILACPPLAFKEPRYSLQSTRAHYNHSSSMAVPVCPGKF